MTNVFLDTEGRVWYEDPVLCEAGCGRFANTITVDFILYTKVGHPYPGASRHFTARKSCAEHAIESQTHHCFVLELPGR